MVITRNNSKTSSKEADVSNVDNSEVFHDSCEEIQPDKGFPSLDFEIFMHQISIIKSQMLNKMDTIKEDIIIQFRNENFELKEEIQRLASNLEEKDQLIRNLKLELDETKSDLLEIERDVAENQQYGRRNNIEICNIPDNITSESLEESVINIGEAVDVKFSKADIQACHRLRKKSNQIGPARTIVRFTNRKYAELLLKKNTQLRNVQVKQKIGFDENIYINSNLCGYYKLLWGKAKVLYKKNLINKFWSSITGVLNIKLEEDSTPQKITHINDLVKLFPEVNELKISKT